MVDDKSEDQPHGKMMVKVQLLGGHKEINRLEHGVHDTARRILGIHGKTG